MNQITTTAPIQVTISSLEIVELVNESRKEDAPKLSHSDFMKKVPRVLGMDFEGAGKFSDTYQNHQNGRTYSCYTFPKREACLMAMSYSYELQAKVYDRMTELETAMAMPTPSVIKSLCDAVASIQSRLDAMASVQSAAQQALAMIEPRQRQGDRLSLVRAYYRIAKHHCKRAIRFAQLQEQAGQPTLALIKNEERQAKLAEGI